ncbi:Rha family transcriptional regulator [Pseudomonas syringae]|uniref:Rha family transcriptional regulator n=1 Tax=Pseudomonas syringae TaxID=317 RepID=UPI001F273589|nr:Rha family transcriptional regulator [Pseudomonas syringae]MCH5554037.1 Rha family transcriptional regulator [Pseudomonas syringae pv. syringae]
MSSLEIAKLTGKRHDSVIRDIRNMLGELESDLHSFEEIYKDQGGRTYPCFNLDRHHTECLLTGYSAKMRMRVIKRWHELEEGVRQAPDKSIIESLSGLQSEVKILKEMIVRSYVKSMRLAEA